MQISSVPTFIKAVLLAISSLYLYNLFLDFYLDDAALYGYISKQMVETGDYITLLKNGQDWLDKPHFPFWITALFFTLFGVSSFTYYLPLTLSIFASLGYTFTFAKRHYNHEVAWVSVLILAASQYLVMASTEGRVEPYLMLCIIASIYHFDRALEADSKLHYTIVALFAAIAMMTKGLFVLIPIFGGIFGHLLFKEKRISFLLHWRWLWLGVCTVLFILPELYALYVQFDSQPEKVIYGQTNVSGIRWFLWESQFSRLVNSGPITRSSGDVFFYLHTLLWTFFPWCFILYGAFVEKLIGFKKKLGIRESYTFFGSVFLLIVFSISKFQLPHYTTVLFPFFAILSASFLFESRQRWKRLVTRISISLAAILVLGIAIASNVFIEINWVFLLLFILITVFCFLLMKSSAATTFKWVTFGSLMMFLLNAFLAMEVYPKISVKGGSLAAEYLNDIEDLDKLLVIGQAPKVVDEGPNFVDFYLNAPLDKTRNIDAVKFMDYDYILVYDNQRAMDSLDSNDYKLVKSFDHYPREGIDAAIFNEEKYRQFLKKFKLFRRN